MHQPHLTDYLARDVAREAYLSYLSRSGANDKVKSGQPAQPSEPIHSRGKSALAARIRDSI